MSQNKRILVVDDNPTNRRILVGSLEKSGHELMEAASGRCALDLVSKWLPDLILLDISMPGMDGFEVCTVLKSCTRTADVPVIFITALTALPHQERARSMGARDYITKPFDLKDMKRRITRALEPSRFQE
jgi:CheY-like chemotaxis protein